MVAAATGSLCEAANAAVQGNASEEKLIASAKAVANSTAQLLLACRVKADPTSVSQKRLQVNIFCKNTYCFTEPQYSYNLFILRLGKFLDYSSILAILSIIIQMDYIHIL